MDGIKFKVGDRVIYTGVLNNSTPLYIGKKFVILDVFELTEENRYKLGNEQGEDWVLGAAFEENLKLADKELKINFDD